MNLFRPYRLAVVDLDDTLLGHDKRVSPANLQALERLRSFGIEVVIASGRHHSNIERLAPMFNFQGWMVSSQGARVQHSRTNEIIYERFLPGDLVSGIHERAAQENASLIGYHRSGVFMETETEWTALYSSRSGHKPKKGDLRVLGFQGLEKLLWSTSSESVDRQQPLLEEAYGGRLYIVNTEREVIEFSSAEATKGAATQALATHLGVGREEILAFGDGNNDVPLLEWAGQSVAMSHGRELAKRAAKLVSPPGIPGEAFARGVDLVLQNNSKG